MQRARVRPDPVSCQSCRSKKLKCNRVQPCSNCTARGITCKFLVPPQGETNTTSTSHSTTEILERIERLESIVLKQTGSAHTPSTHTSDDGYVARQEPRYRSESAMVSVSNIHQKQDQDSRLLENIGTREDSLVRVSRLSERWALLPLLIMLTLDSFLACQMAWPLEYVARARSSRPKLIYSTRLQSPTMVDRATLL